MPRCTGSGLEPSLVDRLRERAIQFLAPFMGAVIPCLKVAGAGDRRRTSRAAMEGRMSAEFAALVREAALSRPWTSRIVVGDPVVCDVNPVTEVVIDVRDKPDNGSWREGKANHGPSGEVEDDGQRARLEPY